jgi:hypothetical protein
MADALRQPGAAAETLTLSTTRACSGSAAAQQPGLSSRVDGNPAKGAGPGGFKFEDVRFPPNDDFISTPAVR